MHPRFTPAHTRHPMPIHAKPHTHTNKPSLLGQDSKLSIGSGTIALPTMIHWSPGGMGREVIFFTVRPVYDPSVYGTGSVHDLRYDAKDQFRVEFFIGELMGEGQLHDSKHAQKPHFSVSYTNDLALNQMP